MAKYLVICGFLRRARGRVCMAPSYRAAGGIKKAVRGTGNICIMVTLLHTTIHHCKSSRSHWGTSDRTPKQMIQDLHALYEFDEMLGSNVSTRQSFALFLGRSTKTLAFRYRARMIIGMRVSSSAPGQKLAANARQSTRPAASTCKVSISKVLSAGLEQA